jgi:hypothetical protein
MARLAALRGCIKISYYVAFTSHLYVRYYSHYSPIVLLDPEKAGVAVGILLTYFFDFVRVIPVRAFSP